MPPPPGVVTPVPAASKKMIELGNGAIGPLTMTDAKKGLALTFGVPPEAVEITIRG
jgi:N-acetylmuramic acid 6-phosphate (MurNAc-6-P) etherase